MNRGDPLDVEVFAWLDEAAQAPVPAAARERALASISSRRPRPSRVARFGSHWVVGPSRVAVPLGRRVGLPVFGTTSTILLLLLALTLIGVALFVGSRQLQQGPEPGRLVFELSGVVYLADQDGGNPVRVAPGGLASGAIWAPDGRHFVFHDDGAHVSDADGRVVASFRNQPGFNGYPTWSPDSAQLQAWTDGFRRISIYGIDGVLQTALSLPDGYARLRENLGVWSPDGRAVWVRIARSSAAAAGEVWELPIDGSAPMPVSGGLHLAFEWSVAPDGSQVAFSGGDGRLYVANPDGTDPRPVIRAADDVSQGGQHPVWSPTGEEIAYYVSGDNDKFGLKVVDVATGIARTVFASTLAGWAPYTWSPEGEELLLVDTGSAPGTAGLWIVGTDGGAPTLLVAGATDGAWQPASPATLLTRSETPAVSVAPQAAPE